MDDLTARMVQHVGITANDLKASLGFWTKFLDAEPLWQGHIEGPHLPAITGYPGLQIEVAWMPLSEAVVLELVQYLVEPEARQPNDMATARPGNVHIALRTDDIEGMWAHALSCGAVATSPEPVVVPGGPSNGARVGYLRDPDGVTFELLQPPPGRGDG